MQLTSHTDYALRLLIYLAVHDDNDAPTVNDAASRYRVSRNHMAKVAQDLAQRGYISGQRGRGGGLRLSHDPADINIGELVRKIESINLVECLRTDSRCRIQQACRLTAAMKEAREAFVKVLEGYTLLDLIRPKTQLVRLLQKR